MSLALPWGRVTPRWSVVGNGAPPALIAGLRLRRAWVSVGPPLLVSGPSRGLVFRLSVGCVKLQMSSLLMLLPCEEIAPPNCAVSQLSCELPATMVFFTRTVVPVEVKIPPPSRADSLETIVELRMFTRAASSATTPLLNPAWLVVLLLLIVLFVMLATPPSW